MKKINKKGFELSMNMIIIVIMAVVFLGVALGLIQNFGKIIKDEIPKIIDVTDALWKPTSENPVLISPSELSIERGKSKTLLLQVYNYASKDVKCNINFNSEDEVDFVYSSVNRDIPMGMVGEWKVSINAPSNLASKSYIYTADIDCGEYSKQSDLIVIVE